MQQETFEQVQADKNGMGGAEKWLKGEEQCVVTLWNGVPIGVQPPNFVELKITETDPGLRGDHLWRRRQARHLGNRGRRACPVICESR